VRRNRLGQANPLHQKSTETVHCRESYHQITIPKETHQHTQQKKLATMAHPSSLLDELIKQHKLKLLENTNTKNAIVEDFDITPPPPDTDMTDFTSDDDDRPIRPNKNKKKRKLVNQYGLLSDDDDGEEDADATPPPATDLTTPKPKNPPPKHGILHSSFSKGTEKRRVTFYHWSYS
jgi:hypothetical protein